LLGQRLGELATTPAHQVGGGQQFLDVPPVGKAERELLLPLPVRREADPGIGIARIAPVPQECRVFKHG
jgi:hypothetical protein